MENGELLKRICQHTGLKLEYRENLIDGEKKISCLLSGKCDNKADSFSFCSEQYESADAALSSVLSYLCTCHGTDCDIRKYVSNVPVASSAEELEFKIEALTP